MNSVLAQTHREFELIVVNDGSSDGTAAYLDALAAADPREIEYVVESPDGSARSAWRARVSRDFTVPTATPSENAISSYRNPSISRRISAVR